MKTWNILFIFLCLCCSTASAQFTDDFSDGDFTNNPTWLGDDTKFIINASNELQLDGLSAKLLNSHHDKNYAGPERRVDIQDDTPLAVRQTPSQTAQDIRDKGIATSTQDG